MHRGLVLQIYVASDCDVKFGHVSMEDAAIRNK